MGHSNYGPHKSGQVAYVSIRPDLSAFERAMGGRPKARPGADLKPVFRHAEVDMVQIQSAWESARAAFRAAAKAFVRMSRYSQSDFVLMPPPPEDKWERALWMRDHRNTGPPTPAAWHRRDIAPTKARARRARGPVNQRRRRSYEFHS